MKNRRNQAKKGGRFGRRKYSPQLMRVLEIVRLNDAIKARFKSWVSGRKY